MIVRVRAIGAEAVRWRFYANGAVGGRRHAGRTSSRATFIGPQTLHSRGNVGPAIIGLRSQPANAEQRAMRYDLRSS